MDYHSLSKQQRTLVRLRNRLISQLYHRGATYTDIAAEYDLSRERVRQIVARERKLREARYKRRQEEQRDG